ncbi:hypothetical protein VKT23_001339 [Stygiomarasmius scandens]|uniref:Uncharacterized protein n=1 Tax=Marasmiellus scandens TaxID=2682957 RepID=A0ABR1K8Q3_9AGAR
MSNHGENMKVQSQLTFATTENYLCKRAKTDTQFLGHANVLQGRSWKEWEKGKCMLVNDDQPREPATFWLVGKISDEDFWLYADGGWNKKLNKAFTSHYATAFLVKPNAGRLSDLFEDVLAGISRIEDFSQRSGVTIKDHLRRRPPKINEDCFLLKHRVFENSDIDSELADSSIKEEQGQDNKGRKRQREPEADRTVTWEEMYKEWPLQSMPCRHPGSREALEKLCNSGEHEHKWSLLEAYNQNELPLSPNEYQKLQGKTVLCSVSISRWEIKKKYSFSFHIVQLQILKPPPGSLGPPPIGSTPSTPSRHKDDTLESPLKKMRMDEESIVAKMLADN